MDILHAIMTRRSIRKFTGIPVDDDQLDKIIRAGFQAPSAHNMQPWEFIVIRDQELLKEIKEFHPYAKMTVDAGCSIVVCGDTNKQTNRGFLVADCSAAIQNMLLTAHGLGLGAVWCGLYEGESLVQSTTKLLNLPDNILPVGMVVVGNKIEDRKPSDRYDEKKVHYNKW